MRAAKKSNLYANLTFFFWFIFATAPLFNFLQGGKPGIIPQLTYGTILLMLLYKCLSNPNRLKALLRFRPTMPGLFLTGMILLCGLSFFWMESFDISTVLTAGNNLCSILVMYLLCKFEDVNKLARPALWGYIAGGLLTALIVLVVHPPEGMERSIAGDGEGSLTLNVVGNIMSLSLIFCYFLFKEAQTKFEYCRVGGAALIFLLTSLIVISKTAILAVMFVLCILLYLDKISMLRVLGGLLLMLPVGILMLPRLVSYLGDYDDLATLTGRTRIWDYAWSMIVERPFFGYGYKTFTEYATPIMPYAVSAHNEWLNMFFQLGLVGVLVLLCIYGSYFLQALKGLKNPYTSTQAKLGMALLIYFLIRGISEAAVPALLFPPAMIVLTTCWLNTANTFVKASSQPQQLLKPKKLLSRLPEKGLAPYKQLG